ncbi:MAG: Rossmann-like and DUF2520 domain-containing protein [Mycobacteriales bacterium]|nr:MAG: oxidoreductase [Pseudonocardiales bacterium]
MRAAGIPGRPGRLAVGVIGTGRVGSVLGAALARAGHRVVAASGSSRGSILLAGRHLPGVPLLGEPEVVAAADLVLLAVPDDALPGLVAGLAETGAWRVGQLVAHVCGVYGVEVLEPVARAGGLPLAIHPVMSFIGRPEDLDRLAGVSFGVTSADALRPVAEALVLEMGGEPVWVPEGARPLYHAALAIGSNHLVTVVAEAEDLLRLAGIAAPGRMLGPLLGAALDNVLRTGDGALTGPVARGDADTVRAHLQTLHEQAEHSVAAYIALARRTADRALAAGTLEPAAAEALLDVLADRSRRTTA